MADDELDIDTHAAFRIRVRVLMQEGLVAFDGAVHVQKGNVFGSRERAGLAWPLTLVKSPAFLSDDIICLTKAGFVLTLSAMAWLVRFSFAFSAMKERMWTASLTFVEYFMGIAPLLYIKL